MVSNDDSHSCELEHAAFSDSHRMTGKLHDALHSTRFSLGFETIKRQSVRKDMTKILTNDDERAKCPHYDQVRQVSFHDIQAKGPAYTRSLVHKVLANEEFCLQMDAHSQLAPDWDVSLKQEWKATGNEFAVLSTIPPAANDMKDFLPSSLGAKAKQVPRQCKISFRDNGVPVRCVLMFFHAYASKLHCVAYVCRLFCLLLYITGL